MSAPSRAKAMATARPIPLSAPVISVRRPLRRPKLLVTRLAVIGGGSHFLFASGRRLFLSGIRRLRVDFLGIFKTHSELNLSRLALLLEVSLRLKKASGT